MTGESILMHWLKLTLYVVWLTLYVVRLTLYVVQLALYVVQLCGFWQMHNILCLSTQAAVTKYIDFVVKQQKFIFL